MNKLYALKQKGFRITSQREAVLKEIYSQPQTVEELYTALRKRHVDIDLASVYRTLLLFSQLHIVNEIDFGDGVKRYEITDRKNHHHHIICRDCGTVKDISLTHENKILQEVSQKSKFNIEKHSLEFFGLCGNCR